MSEQVRFLTAHLHN